MINLKNIVKEISDVFGDPLYVVNDYPDQITLVYSSMVLFELKRESSDIIEYTIIYLGTGEYKMKKIKTTTEKVILDSILNSVAEKKVWADNLQVFDNYVILYYDPTGKSFSLTEYEKAEEERIKKDPILFGVIKDSDKLYYIDSWIDDLCDLTWDQVVEKLSEDKTL